MAGLDTVRARYACVLIVRCNWMGERLALGWEWFRLENGYIVFLLILNTGLLYVIAPIIFNYIVVLYI